MKTSNSRTELKKKCYSCLSFQLHDDFVNKRKFWQSYLLVLLKTTYFKGEINQK